MVDENGAFDLRMELDELAVSPPDACNGSAGLRRVYELDLPSARSLRLSSERSLDVSVFSGEGCAESANDLCLRIDYDGELFLPRLDAGRYLLQLGVEAVEGPPVAGQLGPPFEPPSNSACSGATLVELTTEVDIDLRGATYESADGVCREGFAAYFAFDIPSGQQVRAADDLGLDLDFQFFDMECRPIERDCFGRVCSDSRVPGGLSPGRYILRASSRGQQEIEPPPPGSFRLVSYAEAPPAPANGRCEDAELWSLSLGRNERLIDMRGATSAENEDGADVYYRVQVPLDAQLELESPSAFARLFDPSSRGSTDPLPSPTEVCTPDGPQATTSCGSNPIAWFAETTRSRSPS